MIVQAGLLAATGLCTWLLLRRWRRPSPPSPRSATRLDEAQVRAIAEAAVGPAVTGFSPLSVVEVVETPDGVEWRLSQRVRGSAAFVRVADATGEVLEVGRRGLR